MPVMADIANPTNDGNSPDSFPIEPSDTVNLPRPIRAVRATAGGTIRAIMGNGKERVLNIADAETRYVVIEKIFTAGTTATGLEGMP